MLTFVFGVIAAVSLICIVCTLVWCWLLGRALKGDD